MRNGRITEPGSVEPVVEDASCVAGLAADAQEIGILARMLEIQRPQPAHIPRGVRGRQRVIRLRAPHDNLGVVLIFSITAGDVERGLEQGLILIIKVCGGVVGLVRNLGL